MFPRRPSLNTNCRFYFAASSHSVLFLDIVEIAASFDPHHRAARPGAQVWCTGPSFIYNALLPNFRKDREHAFSCFRHLRGTMPGKIEDYGIIGDGETVALVDRSGSIDWLCWPLFDSDACFAALLGDSRHGYWKISPKENPSGVSRRYRSDTLILETRFETNEGVVTLIDFMPPRGNASDIVRLVHCESGRVKMRMELVIRFGFGRHIPWVQRTEDNALLAICGPDMIVLRTPIETCGEDMTTVANFEVNEGETIPFIITYGASHLDIPKPIDPDAALKETEVFWFEWCSRCEYEGRHSEMVRRSLITLKAMIYAPSGASLPRRPLRFLRNWEVRATGTIVSAG